MHFPHTLPALVRREKRQGAVKVGGLVPCANRVNTGRQLGVLHPQGVAAFQIGRVYHLIFNQNIKLKIGKRLKEHPTTGQDSQPRLSDFMFQRV